MESMAGIIGVHRPLLRNKSSSLNLLKPVVESCSMLKKIIHLQFCARCKYVHRGVATRCAGFCLAMRLQTCWSRVTRRSRIFTRQSIIVPPWLWHPETEFPASFPVSRFRYFTDSMKTNVATSISNAACLICFAPRDQRALQH